MKGVFAVILISSLFVAGTVELDFAPHFPEPYYDMESSPLSQDRIDLGRLLFYDEDLSRDQSISCASCHSPYSAFAHTDHDLSHGIEDRIGTRNAPGLFNLAWKSTFMWDGAIHHLDMQALAPISHPDEMDFNMAGVVERLDQQEFYRGRFFDIYGDSTITGEGILLALSQFQLTLVSDGSKYDSVRLGQAEYTLQEANGYQLFIHNCSSCHQEPLFTSQGFERNNLPIDTTLNDTGKYLITGDPADSMKFVVPTLRNLAFTYPYMHDGRFRKLNDVLKHYSLNLDGIELNANERVDLTAFLLTLNDPSFVFDTQNRYPKELLTKTEGFSK